MCIARWRLPTTSVGAGSPRFFDRLTPERSFWRLGWGVLDTDDWYTPTDGTAAPRPPAPTPDELFLRVERKTLRRFPSTNVVLFTIRTYVTPIPHVVADRATADAARRRRSPHCPMRSGRTRTSVVRPVADRSSSDRHAGAPTNLIHYDSTLIEVIVTQIRIEENVRGC